jgi:hypothetical protein
MVTVDLRLHYPYRHQRRQGCQFAYTGGFMDPIRTTRRGFILMAGTALSGLAAPGKATLGGVGFRHIRRGRSSRRYLVIHGDETTAGEVLRDHMKTHSGHAYLVESQTRNVRPHLLEIDPNRMFSDAGVARSLERLNPSAAAAAIGREVKWLGARRHHLLKALLPPAGGLLIALHNNARGYSVNDEVTISNKAHLPSPLAPHEFFLATSAADFDRIAAGPYNAVLQREAKGDDDGSLSRFCAARGIRYVNIECALGNRKAQSEMLTWLDGLLP